MALEFMSSDHLEEDYIDMEVSSYSNLFQQKSSPLINREFEFQMFSTTRERDSTTSPADELFYNGKLLPLHLPPRLQIVEKIFENTNTFSSFSTSFNRFRENNNSFDHNLDFFETPSMTTAPTPTATSTPFESCNVSPSESFRTITQEIITNPNPSPNKVYINKQSSSSLGSKLKASRAYLKSFFKISGCSNESSTAARKVADEGSALKYVKAKKSNTLGQIQRSNNNHYTKETSSSDVCERADIKHRRSFSLALKSRHSTKTANINKSTCTSSSSSSSSGSSSFSNRDDKLKYFKKGSESENSIQGAIAHCKKSQQILSSRSSVSIFEEQERQQLYRG